MVDYGGKFALALAGGGALATATTAGAANFWNPVGWTLLGAAAIGTGIYLASEHKKNKRPSTHDKHTKQRPGRDTEKKRQKSDWVPKNKKR